MDTGRKRTNPLVAAGRGLMLAVTAWTVSVALFALTLVSLALIPIGVGVLTTPYAFALVREHIAVRRGLADRWAGITLPDPAGYGRDRPARPGVVGWVEVCVELLKSPVTWRCVAWLFADMTLGALLAVLAAVLPLQGVFGLLLAAGLWIPVTSLESPHWFLFVPVQGWTTAGVAGATGAGLIVLGHFAAGHLVRASFRVAALVLAPDRTEELEERIGRLTETRHDALDVSAAELRRIERDLHDGAQARLVAVGMSLGTVEALIEKDPAKAKEFVALARASSAEALTELRDLVRGIHPPVLAERGLGDAVRALALRIPVPTEVGVELPGRAAEPVESAAYFAVSEVLTNAVKHAAAGSIRVDLWHGEGALRIAVTDDGRGGAVVGAGSGLTGIERRLGTFDGVLAVSSPEGGPTMVTMEIPCVLS
jgi:signal transduction histidine kinase